MQNNHAVILQACLKSIKNVHKKYDKYPTEWALSLLQCITFFSRFLFTLYHR